MKNKFKLGNLASALIVIAVMLALVLVTYILNTNEDVPADMKCAKGQDVYNVLILGRDDAAGLCDVIMLGSINTSSGDICFMQIPRDTYFDYSNSTYKKINGIFNSLGSASAVSNAISQGLGIKIDYYLSLGLESVVQLVDAVGGIEIDIPRDMDYSDPSQNLSILFRAGKQTLNGKSAVEFLRYRSGYVTGDLGRIDAQKLFLNAFAKKMAGISNPFTLYNVFKLVCQKGETNIKESDLISIGLKCMKAKGGTVSYVTSPGEAIQSAESGAWYYILSKSAMSKLLTSHFYATGNFDEQVKFVDKDKKSFYDIYNKNCEVRIYTADDIENNKININ